MPSAFDGYVPEGLEERLAQRRLEEAAAVHGMTVKEYDDLQIWMRHGRIGRGFTYQQEVERARKIEAQRRNGVREAFNEGD